MNAITDSIIQRERASVAANIDNLEKQINQLNQQLLQAQQNLLASRGAVLAFDRLIEIENEPSAPAEPSATPVIDVVK